ncbi:ketosteroid isomerase-related protein [Fluviicola taffensis]|uniref:SnoaL-like domain-containing protein n=1 Tax=Fluviicola taffensis (strain DSM 16823 / NCIMB 13979 / RW262) TaxID=755732 RepID=F2IKE2_FLUTR|nr:ketosteroid isomerase-related protein [Fluviicola taffensis]AEA45068.1 Conserved hypothetical protein CHP02096 [Fluviicola taffensis DSM 16823]
MTSLETVKNYYDAFNARNWSEMLALVDENITHEPNQGKTRIGKALFTDFMQHMDASYAETLKDIVLFSSTTEGRIAAEFVVHGTYKQAEPGLPPANGQNYVLPAAAFLDVKNGKITRVTTYYNLELWIELVSK